MNKYLILPGYRGSESHHWQTIWQNTHLLNSERLVLPDYTNTSRESWVIPLLKKLSNSDHNYIVVAHSLGCLAFMHTYSKYVIRNVSAALLVAPPDVEENSNAMFLEEFAPIPEFELDIPSLVVASNDDWYCSVERAKHFAAKWNSNFENVGNKGHINASSGLGHWHEGLDLLSGLLKQKQKLVA
jgi:predicted alpha/beta hydrolase family esterase